MAYKKKGMIKILGTGCWVFDCENVEMSDPENQKIVQDIASNAKGIRGDVISKSLDVEYFLNELISTFFVGNNKKQKEIFNECVLQREFFTFGEKLKVLNFLLKNHGPRFHVTAEKKRLEIVRAIKRVIEYRNKLAHEEIFVSFKERKAFIFDKNGEDLLSTKLINTYHRDITILAFTHMTLETNLMIEIIKECNNQQDSEN